MRRSVLGHRYVKHATLETMHNGHKYTGRDEPIEPAAVAVKCEYPSKEWHQATTATVQAYSAIGPSHVIIGRLLVRSARRCEAANQPSAAEIVANVPVAKAGRESCFGITGCGSGLGGGAHWMMPRY
jgi:hypothetical protein